MDIIQIQTFLAVMECGSFIAAADRVHVTQSTVSMRIRTLEEQLGKSLFDRNRAGAVPTAVGNQFHRHALSLVRIWEQARLDVSLPEGYSASLAIGGQFSLWDGFLMNWVSWIRKRLPDVALRTQLGLSSTLMQRLVDGTLDIGFMYSPQSRPGFEVDLLFREELVLATSEPETAGFPGNNYVYVDWGPEFQADHTVNFPELKAPGLVMDLGSAGLQYILENPGSGYFPRRIVEAHLASGRLRISDQAPSFYYPAYVVYPRDMEPDTIAVLLEGLEQQKDLWALK